MIQNKKTFLEWGGRSCRGYLEKTLNLLTRAEKRRRKYGV